MIARLVHCGRRGNSVVSLYMRYLSTGDGCCGSLGRERSKYKDIDRLSWPNLYVGTRRET